MRKPSGANVSSSLNQNPKPKLDSFSTDFPTSPQSKSEIILVHHFTHPHPLAQLSLPYLFTCAGCKEYGSAKRFACQQCDFQLHEFCASSHPPLLMNHPFHAQHKLVFHSKPKQGGILWPRCDICGKTTKGYTFRCSVCNFQMHPCCALLSSEMKFPIHPHPLNLLPQTKSDHGNTSTSDGLACGECNKKKRLGRVYGCTICGYQLHAVCAKSMINGLHDSGIKPPEKPSKMGIAGRLASQVVIEFIGGFFEGFGQNVADVLIQSMVRGRCISSRRRTIE